MPLEELYAACRIARGLLTGEHAVGRVIARPFEGEPGAYRRTANRHDFSLEPPRPNYLSRIREAGGRVIGVGKICDIFAGLRHRRTRSRRARTPTASRAPIALAREGGEGLVFANLVETDMIYGHRNDPEGFHRCLQEFDARAARPARRARARRSAGAHLRPRLRPDDAPRPITRASTRCSSRTRPGRGPRPRHDGEFADVGATAAAWLGARTGDGLPGDADRRW